MKIQNYETKQFNTKILPDVHVFDKAGIDLRFLSCFLNRGNFIGLTNSSIFGDGSFLNFTAFTNCHFKNFFWRTGGIQQLELFDVQIDKMRVGNILNFFTSIFWSQLSDENISIAMAVDAQYHGNIDLFNQWATGKGPCPYLNLTFARILSFHQNADLWDRNLVNKKFKVMDLLQRFLKNHQCTIHFDV